MKKLSFLLFALCIVFSSCSNDHENTQEEDSAILGKMYNDIIEYSQVNSKTCTNPEEWAFAKFGNSVCTGHIIYSKSINAALFQKKIDQYFKAREKFDVKWGIFYDCMIMPPPTGIQCVEGKATLSYTNPAAY